MTGGLSAADIGFAYPDGPTILDGASMHVEAGQVACLLGPSGAGKTTLLRCIAGLERQYDGSVSWNGAPVDAEPPHRRRFGFLHQEPALFPHLDVAGNIGFGLRYRAGRGTSDVVADWLARIDLSGRGTDSVEALSGGQRQRVAVARALAPQPRAVLLDEPLSALDPALRTDLGAALRKLIVETGTAAIWVTHDETEAARVGDTLWRAEGGAIVGPQP